VLHGAIDLIAWEGARALIVDYKTGRAPDRGSSRMESYGLQARCYALAALEHGASWVEVDFVFVDHDVERSGQFDEIFTVGHGDRAFAPVVSLERKRAGPASGRRLGEHDVRTELG